jgi:hypothetical protein
VPSDIKQIHFTLVSSSNEMSLLGSTRRFNDATAFIWVFGGKIICSQSTGKEREGNVNGLFYSIITCEWSN